MEHLLIIWSNASYKKTEIINDVKDAFIVKKIFKIHWDKTCFKDNLISFYAHSQKHLNYEQYVKIIENKINHCGDNDFFAIIFEDDTPQMEYRDTSSGKQLVNAHVYDKKILYRKWTNGGHKIHCSNDEWETNKDLTILFGLNLSDWLKKYNIYSDIEENFNSNCLGTNGFESIERFFYLLNNTIEYCVLRNFECLPTQYTIDGHGDIDLLVENKNYICYLTHAQKVHSQVYRVYYYININNQQVPFDFRFVGDYYYDVEWEKQILNTRVFNKNIFYTPNQENYFYSLIYHAYIQKKVIKNDYYEKILYLANLLELKVNVMSRNMMIHLLDDFMSRNEYEYRKPVDKSVYYNYENLLLSTYANRYGTFIKRMLQNVDGKIYQTKVFEKSKSFIKIGSTSIINNEAQMLTLISKYNIAPQIIVHNNISSDISMIEISRIQGLHFFDFFHFSWRHHLTYHIKKFIQLIVEIIDILYDNNIIHRDVYSSNILIQMSHFHMNVSLIDFGWAVKTSENKQIITPSTLNQLATPREGWSDYYSLGILLEQEWKDYPYVNVIAQTLKDIKYVDYYNKEEYARKRKKIDQAINNSLSINRVIFDFKTILHGVLLSVKYRSQNIKYKYIMCITKILDK